MSIKKRFTADSYTREPWFRGLCSALLSCKTEEQLADFLGDVGTLGELQDWSERLEVAKHLARGLSYRAVAAATGASTTTVTRVAKSIENGTGGYRRVLKVHRHHRRSAQVRPVEEKPPEPSEQSSVPAMPVPSPAAPPAPRGSELLQKYLVRTEQKSVPEERRSTELLQ